MVSQAFFSLKDPTREKFWVHIVLYDINNVNNGTDVAWNVFLSAALFPSKERRTYPLNLDFVAKKLTLLA